MDVLSLLHQTILKTFPPLQAIHVGNINLPQNDIIEALVTPGKACHKKEMRKHCL